MPVRLLTSEQVRGRAGDSGIDLASRRRPGDHAELRSCAVKWPT